MKINLFKIDLGFELKFLFLIFSMFFSCSTKPEKSQVAITIAPTKTQKLSKSQSKDPTQNNISQEKPLEISPINIEDYQSIIAPWLRYYVRHQIDISAFEYMNQDSLPDINAIVDDFDLDSDIYKPFYKPSPNQRKWLDLSSYKYSA